MKAQEIIRKVLFTGVMVVSALLWIVQPATSQEPVTIRIMTQGNELSTEEIAAFEATNPDIHVELVENSDFMVDLTLSTGALTGDMPDLMRVSASQMSALVETEYLLDLTDYFQSSEIIHLGDIASAASYFRFEDRYYGLPKDWSPDFTLWIYKPAFEAANLPLPSTTEPLTYAEVAELAQKFVVKDGDKVVYHGILIPNYLQTITQILIQQNTSMFNEDYSELQLVDNPAALEVVKFFYDNTLNGSFNVDWADMAYTWSDGSERFPPIIQWGYWYGGSLAPDSPLRDNLMMLPAPTWDTSLPRVDMTGGPFGLVISANTEHPAEAYRFFEWYIVGKGGIDRTLHGWGAPSLLSMFEFLPQESAFDRQRFEVLQGEFSYSDWQMPIYPYRITAEAFDASWKKNMPLALAGEIDFDIFVSNLQEEVNLAILNEQIGN
jgi:multiple sugar transport system substrate-binding protein